MPNAKRKTTLTAHKMAKRIYDREDNVYNKKIVTQKLITDILLMYMDDCRKALAEGERIEISKVGSIIPEVKVHIGNFNLPVRRHIVGGANRTLISAITSLRSCGIGTCRRLSSG